MSTWEQSSEAVKEALRHEWQRQSDVNQKYRSDLFVKAMNEIIVKKDGSAYVPSLLCINDKSTVFEITGVNNTGQWTVKRIWQ